MKNTTSSVLVIGLALGFGAAGCGSNLVAGQSLGSDGGSGGNGSASGGAGGASSAGGAYPQPVWVTSLYIPIAPIRQLDLVFMIDNSPSMAPKQAKLQANFPLLLNALKDPTDGTLPDLRVAIIDSDLGTAGNIGSGSCGPNASNGNDPFGDAGKFRMINASACGVKDPNALWIDYQNAASGVVTNFNSPTGNPQTDINTVFTCLANGLGTQGCGFEHQLQAFEFALRPRVLTSSTDGPTLAAQQAMLRPSAYLGLVFLSDEDDCSAAPNDGMFSSSLNLALASESASLRCATRAHQCGGTNLSNLPPGYPTTAAFTHPFSDCAARTDSCPNQLDDNGSTDTSKPTNCSPLRDIHNLANVIKGLKADPNQILVAGIFGLPLTDSDMATAQYKIDRIFNQNTADTAHPTVFDYWPVCYDPNHPLGNNDPTTQAGYQASVAYGATGGLRLSAFVDEFGSNGLKYSICQPDYSAAMSGIGTAIAKKLQNLCVNATLLDTDQNTPGVQPDCRVAYAEPDVTTGIITELPAMPQCDPTLADANQPTRPCWKLVYDTTRCPGTEGAGVGQLVSVVKDPSAPQVPAGTKLDMLCRTCPAVASGAAATAGCSSTGGVTNTGGADAGTVGTSAGPVGLPCDLFTGDAGWSQSQAIYNPQALECASRICVKPAVAAQAATIDTTGLCSSSCSQDSDCSGQLRDPTNPNDKRCMSGFACAIPFITGPICCQKLCVCKDFYAGSSATTPPACQGSGASGCQ